MNNGAVERLGREILRVARAIFSEMLLPHDQWPDFIPLFQSVLNQSSFLQRNNIASLTAFTGLSPTRPISTFMSSQTSRSMSVNEITMERCVEIKKLQKTMAMLHSIMKHILTANRARARANAAQGVPANSSEGNFVLVARDTFQKNENLCLHWRGLRRVTKVQSDFNF